mgnify:FL=1
MAFLDFYTFDLTHLVIISLISLLSFMVINYIEKNKDEKYVFNVSLSLIIGIIVSIIYSYITIEPDVLLTSNYWD